MCKMKFVVAQGSASKTKRKNKSIEAVHILLLYVLFYFKRKPQEIGIFFIPSVST